MSISGLSQLVQQTGLIGDRRPAKELIFRTNEQGVFLAFYSQHPGLLLRPGDGLIGHRIEEGLPPLLAELTHQKLIQARAQGSVQAFECSVAHDDGLRYYEGRVFCLDQDEVMVIFGDISTRRASEIFLHRQALTFETMFDAIILTDEQGMICEWNPAAVWMYGYSRDEAIGQLPSLIQHPDDQPSLQQEIQAVIHRRQRWVGRARFVRKNGAEGVSDVIVVPILDADGRIIGTVGVNRDITERVSAEEILKRREAILDAVSYSAEAFLKAPVWQKNIDDVLACLGQASHVSRVYIFQNALAEDGQLLMNQRYEWVNTGIAPQIDNPALQNIRYSEFAPRWEQVLKQGLPLHGLIATFPSEERLALEAQDILSIAVVPIFVGSEWWGFIGFDQCSESYLWAPAELDALRAAASTLGAAIQRERFERLHAVTMDISDAVYQAGSLDEFYTAIHRSVSELMPAKNFYIALYDSEQDLICFPYFVDECDPKDEAYPPGKGLTEYVLRHGEPLFAPPDVFESLVASGEVELVGAPSLDWLGVPLKNGGKTIGVVAVQSYSQAVRFDQDDLELLTFVSHQIAMTIERKLVQTALLESEAKYRSLVESLPIGIYQVTPGPTGKILVANSAFMALFAIPSIDVLHSMTVSDLYENPEERRKFSDMVLAKGQVNDVELRLKKADNTPVWGAVTASVVRDSQGKADRNHPAEYFNCLLVDITERKKRNFEREAVITLTEALRGVQTRVDTIAIVIEQLLAILIPRSIALILKAADGEKHIVEAARGDWQSLTNRRLASTDPLCQALITIDEPKVYPASWLAGSIFLNQADAEIKFTACAPLITHGQTTGVICIGRFQTISPDNLSLLGTLADIASNAIYRATFYEQTQCQLQRLSSLRTIDMAIGNSMDLRLTLNIILDHVTTQLALDAADILTFNSRDRLLELAASRGFRMGTPGGRIPLGQGLAGQAVLERRTIISYNLVENDREVLTARNLAPERFVTYCALPLVAKGQVKGLLEVFHRVFYEFQEDKLDFLQTVAGEAAIAIDNYFLFSELQRSNTELSLAYDNTLEGWVRIQEYREGRPPGRTRRLVEATIKLARLSGIPESDLLDLRRGALLHDIGTMVLPDTLLKTALASQLQSRSEAEALFRRHPQFAYDLLYPITYLRPALDIPYCHHENWDGTGYPRGLFGDQIPLSARVFAVIYAWDELAHDHPERYDTLDADLQQALRTLAGTRLDPDLVERFLDMFMSI